MFAINLWLRLLPEVEDLVTMNVKPFPSNLLVVLISFHLILTLQTVLLAPADDRAVFCHDTIMLIPLS